MKIKITKLQVQMGKDGTNDDVSVKVTIQQHKGYGKKPGIRQIVNGSGGGMVCPRKLSFSQFVVLVTTSNWEKNSILGQMVLPPEPLIFFFEFQGFFHTLYLVEGTKYDNI